MSFKLKAILIKERGKNMSIPELSREHTHVNISNSLLKHFGAKTFHDSYKPLDEILERNKGKKIVFILTDGFGKFIQEATKDLCPFIYSHGKFDIDTVYPPTTVAVITSLLSGKYPVETGWLGWTLYSQKTDEFVETFSGILEGTKDQEAKFKPSRDLINYTPIDVLIDRAQGKKVCKKISCFDYVDKDKNPVMDEFIFNLNKSIKEEDNKFIYAYWNDPDHTLHAKGLNSMEARKSIASIDEHIKALVEANPDVIFLTLADHGHTPITWDDIRKYPDFIDTLKMPRFAIEPRFATFWIKDGREQDFIKSYEKHFSKDFACYSRDQIYKEHVFGYAPKNNISDPFIGDFTLIATGTVALFDGYNYEKLVSTHAGSLPIETKVELGVYNAD